MPYQPKFNEQKATEAASMLISLNGGSINYMSLIKLLYFIDREALNRWERPITYDVYKSLPHGPIVNTIYNLIMGKLPSVLWKEYIHTIKSNYDVVLTGSPPKTRKMSKIECDLIKEIYSKYGHFGPFELEAISHTLPEWQDPDGSSLPLELVDLLKALNFHPDDVLRVESEIMEEQLLDEVLSG